MDQGRHEVYERIPWETLERPRPDRQWLVIAVAGAVAIGALAYSFMRSQPVAPPPTESAMGAMDTAADMAPATPIPTAPATVPSPVVVAEADLFAVDPERLIDQVAAHAEWFAVEYFSVDGSAESRAVLSSLLPVGVPLPNQPEGIQVFVDWVGVQSVVESAPLTYSVEVVVRSLVSNPDGVFSRQPTRLAMVEILIGSDGAPRVAGPPAVTSVMAPTPHPMGLVSVPESVASGFAANGEVIGGVQMPDGSWNVVVMVIGPDGVTRPVTMWSP